MNCATILVVDEEREAEAVKTILGAAPYHVMTAACGEQALNILESDRRIGVVIAEVVLPGGASGVEFAGKVRHRYPATAVVLMTRSRPRIPESSIPLLVKPFSAAVVLEKIERLLEDRRRIAESLATTFKWNREATDQLRAARDTLRDSIERSRHGRAARFCSELQAADGRTATILVVDDDAGLRYAVCRYLTHCGFSVLPAAAGPEALELSRAHDGRIDLLLTDFRMPGLTGDELVDQLVVARPHLQVLVMTADDVMLPRRTLRKPFELEDLLIEIATMLTLRAQG